MNPNRLLIISVIALILIGIGLVTYRYLTRDVAVVPDVPVDLTETPGFDPNASLAAFEAETQSYEYPSEDRISIQGSKGSTEVRNFFGDKVFALNDDNTVYLRNEPTYDIIYYRKEGSFLIQLSISSLEEARAARTQAEADFLALIGGDKAAACRLDVELRVQPTDDYDDLAQADYGISFCTRRAF